MTGINPAVVLIAVLMGVNVAGFLGLLLAVTTASLFIYGAQATYKTNRMLILFFFRTLQEQSYRAPSRFRFGHAPPAELPR